MGNLGRQRCLEFARNSTGEAAETERTLEKRRGSPSSFQLSVNQFTQVKKLPKAGERIP